MGIFSKKLNPDPVLILNGIEYSYYLEGGWWSFVYKEIEFMAFEARFEPPTTAQLDDILREIERLTPEMIKRLDDGLAEDGIKTGTGENYAVHLDDFKSDGVYVVSWSEGKDWGDWMIEFEIENGAIIDESWGD